MVEFNFVSKKEIATLLDCHYQTVNTFCKKQGWTKGIHYVEFEGKVFYNRELLKDLIQCGGDVNSKDHINAIALYNQSRLGNQLVRGRSRNV